MLVGKSVQLNSSCVLDLFLIFFPLFFYPFFFLAFQMILYLAEASTQFGCTVIFKEPSKFAWSDYYEEHFSVPHDRIVLVTNKRVMLLQVSRGALPVDL
jgi:hypothetical protein